MDYQDVRLKGVVRQVEVGVALEIDQRDDFANVTGVDRAKGIPPMMIHWDGVHLQGMGLAKRIAQARVGQVDARVK